MNSGSSKVEAIASRQRDWRTSAKSLIASRVDSCDGRPARASRARPSPFQRRAVDDEPVRAVQEVAASAGRSAAARRATRR